MDRGAIAAFPGLGPLGWYVVKPFLAAGVADSLRRFARFAARR